MTKPYLRNTGDTPQRRPEWKKATGKLKTVLSQIESATLEQITSAWIEIVCARKLGNRRHTAEALGLSEQTLRRLNRENRVKLLDSPAGRPRTV